MRTVKDTIRAHQYAFVLVALLMGTLSIFYLLGGQFVVMSSGSMEPAFQRGDVLFLWPASFNSIQEGDIIVYRTAYMETPIPHRVVSRNKTTLTTKGDNNVNQIKFCVEERHTTCSPYERVVKEDNRQVCVKPFTGRCSDNNTVNVETGITADQVTGMVMFALPTGKIL